MSRIGAILAAQACRESTSLRLCLSNSERRSEKSESIISRIGSTGIITKTAFQNGLLKVEKYKATQTGKTIP